MTDKPIYFAITAYKQDSRFGEWSGFFPEEVGHTYQDLCQYARRYGCAGGFKLDDKGNLTHYTADQLDEDYDRDCDHSSCVETNDYHWQQEDRDIERAREAGRL